MCTSSKRRPLVYLRSGVSEQEAARSISGEEKDKWTKGLLECWRLASLKAAHVFLACPS